MLISMPFAFFINAYPFLQARMFSAPPGKPKSEKFIIFLHAQGEWKPLRQSETAMPLYRLEYLARNHYYRNELSGFLNSLEPAIKAQPDSIAFIKITESDSIAAITRPFAK